MKFRYLLACVGFLQTERKLNKFVYILFTKNRISQQTYRYLHSTDSIALRIFGLPKIHKSGFPFRPILSFINSPLYNLSKFIAVLLTPLVGTNGFTVKNSYEFVEQLKNLTINHDECIVLFDVISLFTKIPVDVAKTVVLERLKKDDTLDNRSGLTLIDIAAALNLCLDNTYLYFRGKFHRQIFGVAMGSPISVIIANLVMENVEEGAMSNFLNPPKFWKRYVDDTFVIIKKTEVDKFHNYINDIKASIKFTIERETNNSISFLYVCVTRKASGGLTTNIYKKPTHINRYLNFNSAHSTSQKQGLVKCLLKRAFFAILRFDGVGHAQYHVSIRQIRGLSSKHAMLICQVQSTL